MYTHVYICLYIYIRARTNLHNHTYTHFLHTYKPPSNVVQEQLGSNANRDATAVN